MTTFVIILWAAFLCYIGLTKVETMKSHLLIAWIFMVGLTLIPIGLSLLK